MKITLEIDNDCIPGINGRDVGPIIFEAIKNNPKWWFDSADVVRIEGEFGRFTEDRYNLGLK
jgi:hypothetical protein